MNMETSPISSFMGKGVHQDYLFTVLALVFTLCVGFVWRRTRSCECHCMSDKGLLRVCFLDPQPGFCSYTSFQGASDVPLTEHHGDKPRVKQPYDAFLVLDVEGTCEDGPKAFDYPNEIIASSRIHWPNELTMMVHRNGRCVS